VFFPAAITILWASYALFLHWFDAQSLCSSAPLPELIFILLSMIGFLVISKAETESYLRMCGWQRLSLSPVVEDGGGPRSYTTFR